MSVLVTIDTNVLISGLINNDSYPGKVVNKALSGDITPLVDYDILFEYLDVLTREKFSFNKILISKVINMIIARANFIDRIESQEEFIDEDDRVFYEVTLAARKDSEAYLTTGNLKHYPKKPFVVEPKQMCQIIDENSK